MSHFDSDSNRAYSKLLFSFLLGVSVSIASTPLSAAAATFVVNSVGDEPDVNPGTGGCFTGALVFPTPGVGEAECTLRAAIEESNASAGDDVIEFASNIPLVSGYATISPQSALPSIGRGLLIDGESAPGYDPLDPNEVPVVQLNGSAIPRPSSARGLSVQSAIGSVVIRGLAIYGFPSDGVAVLGSVDATTQIQGCHIGLSRGSFVIGNEQNGVLIFDSIVDVGKTCTPTSCFGRGNVISGNALDGVSIAEGIVQLNGNTIGTDPAGTTTSIPFGGATPNLGWGVSVDAQFYGSVRIGYSTTDPTAGNLISGNLLGGIDSRGGPVLVFGNLIGTNRAGTAALPNEGPGVNAYDLDGAATSQVLIGGAGANDANLISGNFGAGLVSTGNVTTEGNTIGLTLDQSTLLENGLQGILLLGDDAIVRDNTVGAHPDDGIVADGSGHRIIANLVGTNSSGVDLGGDTDGILILGDSIQVGEANLGNTVGFHASGVSTLPSASDAVIQGNFLGTDVSGRDLGNSSGVLLLSNSNLVGGLDGLENGLGNTVGHNSIGILVSWTGLNRIQGNFIGTNASTDSLSNSNWGILVDRAGAVIGAGAGDTAAQVHAGRNLLAHDTSGAVTVVPLVDATPLRGNLFVMNPSSQPPIDLNYDGFTPNDFGDVDTGANQLQNFPEFVTSQTQWNEVTGQLEVRYRVNSNQGDATYPIDVDFYLRTNADAAADVYLGSDSYPSSAATLYRSVAINPLPGVEVAGALVATATDALGNTSELSRQLIYVPEPRFLPLLLIGVVCLAGFARPVPSRSQVTDPFFRRQPTGRACHRAKQGRLMPAPSGR